MQTLKEIENIFSNTPYEKLQSLALSYASDERIGVKKIVEKYDKKLAAYRNELERLDRMMLYERKYDFKGLVGGVDEAGRGPLAGPVIAACVILPKDHPILYVNDSKQLSATKRDELFDIIVRDAISYGIGAAGEQVIDEINILQATYAAMRSAIEKMPVKPDCLLNDAVKIPGLDIYQIPIVKGDAKSASIAAASILAKVTRDRLMVEYDRLYPEYGFASHKGYGSASHIEALKKYGPCPIHRRTFIGGFIDP